MKQTRKICFSALLCLFTALSLFLVSCAKRVPDNAVRLVDNGVTSYRIVRSDESDVGKNAAVTLRSALDRITDGDVKIITDFEHEKIGTVRTDEEILIGPTNRDESKHSDLTYYDYDIRFLTTRLAVNGGSDAALEAAVRYLLDNFYYKNDCAFALPEGFVYEYRYDYPLKSITIGGHELSEFSIVSATSDARAQALADSFLPVYGRAPKCVTPQSRERSGCEIILSSAKDERYADVFASLSDLEYMYKIDGTKVYIGSNGNLLGDAQALEMFLADCFGGDPSLLSGSLVLGDMTRVEKIEAADAFEATDAFLASIDEESDALKNAILTSENLAIPEGAAVYYVSENGSDENDGTSPEKAWQTLNKVNHFEFDPEKPSYVLFERGGVWRGQIGAQANVTYSAYGEGKKPCLYGSPEDGADPALWSLLEGSDNIWVYAHEMMDSGTLVFNGGEKAAYKEIPSYVGGRYVKRNDPETPFDLVEALDNDLDFFHAADSIVNGVPQVGSAQCVGKIYLRCDEGNPGEVFESIEFLPRRNGFGLKGNNITINNFTIKYVGAHGIGGGNRTGITVSDCEIGWIGGGIQSYNAKHAAVRYGNGIEIYVSCKDFTVDHCYIYEVYDAGVTHQFKGQNDSPVTMKNVEYSNNLIENCVYSVEYFLGQDDEPYQLMSDIRIHDNIMRFAGYGWGNQRPNNNVQAHIKGWDHANPAWDFRIYNNIFDRSSNWMVHCGYTNEQDMPLFENNIFIQDEDGFFGTYRTNPTGNPVPYGAAMLTDERLKDNDFYFIRKK